MYAGFYTVANAQYSGEKIAFRTFWDGYRMRGKVKKFSRRIFLFFVLLFVVMILMVFGAFDDIPDFILQGPLPIVIFLAFFSAGVLYQIALPNALFINEISGKEAYAQSREAMFQQLGPAALLFFILVVLNILGAMIYGLGLLFTIPFSAYCWQYLWETQAGDLKDRTMEEMINQIGQTGENESV